MIHEDDDEIVEADIDFSWIYFICRVKLNLTDKESGRLALCQFRDLYQAYKNTFDLELCLLLSRKTYKEIDDKQNSDEWFTD